jgi:hypothetical protein
VHYITRGGTAFAFVAAVELLHWRSHLARENRPSRDLDLALAAVTAAVTFVGALGVSGGTNLVMLATGNPLIKKYRPTLTFRSAYIGDGIILPIVNVLIMRSLVRWKPQLMSKQARLAVPGGPAISLLFHITQGSQGMVNWTMTRPWRWNLLGYYHFVYMATQFSYMVLYVAEFLKRLSSDEVDTSQKRDAALIAGNMALFALLLATDYSE